LSRSVASGARRRRPPKPPLPPGGGLRPGPRGRQSCPECGSPLVTQITLTLTDGTPVDFLSCQVCEHKNWTAAGEALALDRVLSKARKPR
jgi:hypothetical protein